MYFTLLDSALLYHGYTSLCLSLLSSNIALFHCTWLYSFYINHISLTLYFPLPFFYFIPLHSTLHYHGSTWLYFTLLHFSMALLYYTWLYIKLPRRYFTLIDSALIYHGSTSLHGSTFYLTLLPSTIALLHSTCQLYICLPWLYFTTLIYYSTSLYFTLRLLPYTMVLLHSTWLYITLPWLYFILLDSRLKI